MELYHIALIYLVGAFITFMILMFTTDNFKDADSDSIRFVIILTLLSWLGVLLLTLWWLDEGHKNN